MSLSSRLFIAYLFGLRIVRAGNPAAKIAIFTRPRHLLPARLPACPPAHLLDRYAEGVIPVCCLKYLPKNDWFEKFR